MNEYVCYSELKDYKGVDEDSATDDARWRSAVIAASRAWDRWTWRTYYPRKETRSYDHVPGSVLKLQADLLEAQTVKTQNGGVTITSGQYYPMCGDSYDVQPYDRIVLRSDQGVLFSFSGTKQKANEVTGIWGYHQRYSEAWLASGDTVQNSGGISDSGLTLEVNEVDGLGPSGFSPRFRAGQILKVEDELLYIARSAGVGANALAVKRGINGTTAAAHDQGTAISIWEVWPDVWEHVKELSAYLFDLKDSQVYDVTATPETGMMTMPKGVPAQVKLAVRAYRRY